MVVSDGKYKGMAIAMPGLVLGHPLPHSIMGEGRTTIYGTNPIAFW